MPESVILIVNLLYFLYIHLLQRLRLLSVTSASPIYPTTTPAATAKTTTSYQAIESGFSIKTTDTSHSTTNNCLLENIHLADTLDEALAWCV